MTVELIDHMGNDLRVVNAARVSYGKQSSELTDADRGLIRFLARERHGSPFEHVVFTFRVKVPIFVAREWQRHRIGSFSEISGRYVELEPEFYAPELDAVRRQVGKPGAYSFEPTPETEAQFIQWDIAEANARSYTAYRELLDLGVAKELARTVLPVSTYTQFIWTVNLRSLTNFLSLRTAPNALLEIRQEADEVERLVREVVPVCMAAWDEGGRMPI